jgi:hypothetical protein
VFWAILSSFWFGRSSSAARRTRATSRNEILESGDEFLASGDIESVDSLAPVPFLNEQPPIGQHLQVMRHGRPGERKMGRQLSDIEALAGKEHDDPLPSRIAQGDQETPQFVEISW